MSKSSAASWVSFFRDAGIPYSLAKSYASTFEENRIGKDMLLDLDKDILGDMGIKVMGDVIGILKHAKKEARKDSSGATVSGTTSSKHKSSSAVHSTQSAPQAPAVSTTSSPLHDHCEEGYLGVVGLMEYQDEREPEHLSLEEHTLQPVEPEFTALQSDLIQQVVAAVTQQQQVQQQCQEVVEEEGEGAREIVNPALLGIEDEFQEEYVTEAYKRQQQKRALGSLYSDSVFQEAPQSKQPRLIILPQDDANEVGGVTEDLQILATPPLGGETSSRRLLEAAGLVKRGEHIHVPSSEKPAVSSSASVFSRLDGKGRGSPPLKTYLPPPSSSSTNTATSPPHQRKRTVVTAASPSPQKLGLQVTARDGRRVSTTPTSGAIRSTGSASRAGSGGGGVVRRSKRESSVGGLVSSSSSFAAKEPVKSRLGAREHGGGGGYGGSEGWTNTVSTSSHSGRMSTRLGGGSGHRESTGPAKRTRHTMVADSATNPPPKASSRLGAGHKSSTSSLSAAVVSSATRTRDLVRRSGKVKTSSPSMKADEYEMRRQLDIRSRLAAKEKEVEQRRSGGVLRGRLGQHHVFMRLT
ncbi:Uncharacterized protein C19orf47 homolog [Geodia barretti]|uniref:Uncharacterized protein C19orf47 homolog n=1 Tax=Geodia barretti TaxID=519541 RepID=A0AA35X3Z0_GEOBA|nr:Uncharacterized protein C19orf47 homolog [Geodia barretti]